MKDNELFWDVMEGLVTLAVIIGIVASLCKKSSTLTTTRSHHFENTTQTRRPYQSMGRWR